MTEQLEFIHVKSGNHYWFIGEIKMKIDEVWQDGYCYRDADNKLYSRLCSDFMAKFKMIDNA